jgi:hypothetical protein
MVQFHAVINHDRRFERLDDSDLKYKFIMQNDLGRQSEFGRPRSITAGCCTFRKSDSIDFVV